jgi:hypothetical protein
MPWGDEDMTGSFNTSHYEDIRGRVLGVLISVAESLSRRQVDLLHELIDQNESGVALEMLVEMLFRSWGIARKAGDRRHARTRQHDEVAV